MKTRIAFVMLVLLAIFLAACGGSPKEAYLPLATEPAATEAPMAIEEALPYAPDAQSGGAPAEGSAADAEKAAGELAYNTGSDPAVFERMVIKNGEINLLVKDCPSIFCGQHQMIKKDGYIMTFMDVFAHFSILRRKRRGIQSLEIQKIKSALLFFSFYPQNR